MRRRSQPLVKSTSPARRDRRIEGISPRSHVSPPTVRTLSSRSMASRSPSLETLCVPLRSCSSCQQILEPHGVVWAWQSCQAPPEPAFHSRPASSHEPLERVDSMEQHLLATKTGHEQLLQHLRALVPMPHAAEQPAGCPQRHLGLPQLPEAKVSTDHARCRAAAAERR